MVWRSYRRCERAVLVAPFADGFCLLGTSTPARRIYGDFKLMLVAVLIGLILDSTWINLGWLEFSAGWPVSEHSAAMDSTVMGGSGLNLESFIGLVTITITAWQLYWVVVQPVLLPGGSTFRGGQYFS